jgi:hypothetical protein
VWHIVMWTVRYLTGLFASFAMAPSCMGVAGNSLLVEKKDLGVAVKVACGALLGALVAFVSVTLKMYAFHTHIRKVS